MFYVQVFPTCFLHQVVCSFPSFDIVDWLLLARDCEAIKHWYVHELHLDYQQLFDAWHRLSHHKQSTCLMSIVPGWWREENGQLIFTSFKPLQVLQMFCLWSGKIESFIIILRKYKDCPTKFLLSFSSNTICPYEVKLHNLFSRNQTTQY